MAVIAPTRHPAPSYRLAEVLAHVQAMLANNSLDPVVIGQILRALGPVVLRHQWWLRQQFEEARHEADRKLAGTILAMLRHCPTGELSRSQISNLLWRNQTSRNISAALELLRKADKATMRKLIGRPGRKGWLAELWRATADTAEDDFTAPIAALSFGRRSVALMARRPTCASEGSSIVGAGSTVPTTALHNRHLPVPEARFGIMARQSSEDRVGMMARQPAEGRFGMMAAEGRVWIMACHQSAEGRSGSKNVSEGSCGRVGLPMSQKGAKPYLP